MNKILPSDVTRRLAECDDKNAGETDELGMFKGKRQTWL